MLPAGANAMTAALQFRRFSRHTCRCMPPPESLPGNASPLDRPELAGHPDPTRSRPLFPLLLPDHAQAVLALADGTVFQGVAIGAAGETSGEVVFNTAMTGYQEILTDPSYCRQIVTLTYPHVGSYGTSPEDVESSRVHAAGLVVKDVPPRASNFRSTASLGDYLTGANTVAIAGIDTRRLTRLLRSGGAQSGCIVALAAGVAMTDAVRDRAVVKARAEPSMAGLDLARVVSVREPYEWHQTAWALGSGYGTLKDARFHVVAYDFGVKFNILRMLASRGCRITVVPAQTPAAEALALRPDGVFLANGPGDPEPCDYAVLAVRELVARGVPTFGICLGHQIMALAAGAHTYKMKFGHHGANHPVKGTILSRPMPGTPPVWRQAAPQSKMRQACAKAGWAKCTSPICATPTATSCARCTAWGESLIE